MTTSVVPQVWLIVDKQHSTALASISFETLWDTQTPLGERHFLEMEVEGVRVIIDADHETSQVRMMELCDEHDCGSELVGEKLSNSIRNALERLPQGKLLDTHIEIPETEFNSMLSAVKQAFEAKLRAS